MGGVLFIGAYYFISNNRDYGLEAIEILHQVLENRCDDLELS